MKTLRNQQIHDGLSWSTLTYCVRVWLFWGRLQGLGPDWAIFGWALGRGTGSRGEIEGGEKGPRHSNFLFVFFEALGKMPEAIKRPHKFTLTQFVSISLYQILKRSVFMNLTIPLQLEQCLCAFGNQEARFLESLGLFCFDGRDTAKRLHGARCGIGEEVISATSFMEPNNEAIH